MTVAVFGASGAIGQAICRWHLDHGRSVVGFARSRPANAIEHPVMQWLTWDQADPDTGFGSLPDHAFDAVVWAQGMNLTDDIRGFDIAAHDRIYAANVTYILQGLHVLLSQDKLAKAARLCIISSIWQNISRPNKLSYCVTKAALQGLVQSLCIDLGPEGVLVNAVLPGALDTPMTRANLNPSQIEKLEGMTPLGSLPALDDVCALVGFLCSPANTGVTGQFIAADKGFSYAKLL